MGKKKFNAKARQQQNIQIDNTETRKIHLELPQTTSTNDSNTLVLPSQKRATKVKKDNVQVTRILSKKQRKRLEKVIDQKKKKENRASLVEALASVQIPHTQLATYASISSIQTKGLKRLKLEKNKAPRIIETTLDETDAPKISNKRKRLELLEESSDSDDEAEEVRDPNVVGMEESSSEEDENMEVEPVKPEKIPVVVVAPKPEAKKVKLDVPTVKKVIDRKPAVYIHVDREPKIQAARLQLPILAEEQVVMETISENNVVIIVGETGSGKTTQVPQFLYEAGYGEKKMIGITEPRRVAAISMSKRVATEMNLSSDIVSYLMRFEGNVTDDTKVKFMTDGVLLKEVETDFLLRKYSVIILDEAHERSVFTDILIGLLSRIIIIRERENDPLKLIIMSATIEVKNFTENRILFKTPPPVLNIQGRQYEVQDHFEQITDPDYVMSAYKKVVNIHNTLPEGGILVFVTGQKEVKSLVYKLRKAFPYKPQKNAAPVKQESSDEEESFDEEDWDMVRTKKKKLRKKNRVSKKHAELPKINLDSYKLPSDEQAEEIDEVDSDELDEDEIEVMTADKTKKFEPLWVLPLYSVLSSQKQAQVFQEPPTGTRLCVVATNIAETSITIPNIKYVVDSGKQKTKVYDKVTGVSSFSVTWISKASAAQRSGRAGRVGPGHCYRLYTPAVFQYDFMEHSVAEIQEKPVEDLMLQMKVIGVDKVDKFPFPSPPDPLQLQVAEKKLKMLGALQTRTILKGNTTEELVEISDLGRIIARFPVNPRFGKMLALSDQGNLLPYVVILVAALSVPNLLQEGVGLSNEEEVTEERKEILKKFREIRHHWAGDGESRLLGDPMVLLQAVISCLVQDNLEQFCAEHGLRLKGMEEVLKIRQQLTNDINLNAINVDLSLDPWLSIPNDQQITLLRQILLSGLCDKVARKMTKQEIKEDKKRFRYAYKCMDIEDAVFIHQESALKYEDPEWLIYNEAYEVTMEDGTQKMFLRGTTAIEATWLPQFCPSFCNVLKILEKPEPRYDTVKDEILCHATVTFSRAAWQLPELEMPMEVSIDLYKYFAKFLLAGEIFPALAQFKEDLVSSPESMTKTWAKLLPRTKKLLDTLLEKEIRSKKIMKAVWKKDRNFLLEEYKLWLPDHLHFSLKKIWPPIK